MCNHEHCCLYLQASLVMTYEMRTTSQQLKNMKSRSDCSNLGQPPKPRGQTAAACIGHELNATLASPGPLVATFLSVYVAAKTRSPRFTRETHNLCAPFDFLPSPQEHQNRHLGVRLPPSLFPSPGPSPTEEEAKIRVLSGVGVKMAATAMTYACGGKTKTTVDVQKVVDVVRAAGAAIMQVYTEDAKVGGGHGAADAAATAVIVSHSRGRCGV